MFGLVMIEVMTPSGHLSNINEIIKENKDFISTDDNVFTIPLT